KSIWEFIQDTPDLSQLKKVLKYAGKGSKELLDDKEKKITFFAPLNVERKHRAMEVMEHGDPMEHVAAWDRIVREVDDIEASKKGDDGDDDEDDDDERKKRRRKILAFLIDATIRYHVVDSAKPLTAWELAQNSTVASLLKVHGERTREVVGNLLDGEPFRVRVGKVILPRWSVVLNGYSPIVYRDVEVGGSLVHGVRYPLLIPPSTLQALFYGQATFSTLTSAAQKVDVDTYLKIPFNHSAVHHHHHNKGGSDKSLGLVRALEKDHETHPPAHAHGLEALTLFAPGNLAFLRLPAGLKLFLFSPFGSRVLQKVLAFHTLPRTAFFADAVYGVPGVKAAQDETRDAAEVAALFGEAAGWGGPANVTRFKFDTALPKLRCHKHKHGDEASVSKKKPEFEQVDVEVFRYYPLPGGKGPLQTRIAVEGVPVVFQDISTANGAAHLIERFIVPKSLRHGHGHDDDDEDASSYSIWHHVVDEAERAGYGRFDL
ncbi:hypothetical protein FA10DRAFT_220424, partial [Acaromyces ingoldii]